MVRTLLIPERRELRRGADRALEESARVRRVVAGNLIVVVGRDVLLGRLFR